MPWLIKSDDVPREYGKYPGSRSIEELIRNGIIILDKWPGPTSHDVSAVLKKVFNLKKTAHSGTLDPAVSGVLPIMLENACKIMPALQKLDKEYVGVMHLHRDVDDANLKEAVKKFIGEIRQTPPKRSAVARRERMRKVYSFELLDRQGRDVVFRVNCQAGTYIRKLCLHPNTEIISTESLLLAKDFFINTKPIYTMNNRKIQQKYPSEVQKIKFKGKMIKIRMASGIDFVVTPEHKMLTSSDNGYIMKEASKLTKSDYIVKSLTYNLPEIIPPIVSLLDDSYLIDQKEIKDLVKKEFIKKYGSIREVNRRFGLDRKAFLSNSEASIPISHIKKSGIYESVKNNIHEFKTEKGIKIDCSGLDSDLLYLLGLIASDGNNTKEKNTKRYTRIKFHNKNKGLIHIFIRIYKKKFPNLNITKTVRNDGLVQLDTSNSFLASIASNLGIKSPQKSSDILPILYLNKKLVASFLKGYFDGDGTANYYKKRNAKGVYRRIAFFTINERNAKRLHQMLLKLDISNKVFKSKDIYTISINDIASKKYFVSLIGSNHPSKRRKLEIIKNIKYPRYLKDNLYIGFQYKNILKENKSKLYRLGGNLNRILISNVPLTRGLYKKISKLVDTPELDEFCIEKIKSTDFVDYDGEVYDMTVPNTHNFLIETGFISSNCDDLGKKIGGAHMAELRRTKVGRFSESQAIRIQDVVDAYEFWKEKQDEDIRKYILPVEAAIEHLGKVIVKDSAVAAIANGSPLYTAGICKIETGIEKDSLVALLTLKGELIALASADMSSEEMLHRRGIAAKTDKVIMDKGIYPKF